MGTSGPFRLVLLDDPPPGDPPVAAVRLVADRLVSIAKQRSPVDARALFDAHDMYFRISAWTEAWQALILIVNSLGIENTSEYTHCYQQLRRWMDPVEGGLSPACGLPPREAAEFIHVIEVVMHIPAEGFLDRPEFATLWDNADTDHVVVLSLPRANDQDFATAVSYLKSALPTHSKEALSVRAEELNGYREYYEAIRETNPVWRALRQHHKKPGQSQWGMSMAVTTYRCVASHSAFHILISCCTPSVSPR